MTTEHENTPSGPDSGAADLLAGLAAEAAALETGQVVAQQQAEADQQAAAVATATAEAREIVNLAGSLLVPLLPERYAKCYGPAELGRIGDALGAVAAKRGWNLGNTLGAWGPEIALVAACAGPVLPVLLAEAKAKREAAEKGTQPATTPAPAPAPTQEQGDNPLAGTRVI
jgi:hypothetical protein